MSTSFSSRGTVTILVSFAATAMLASGTSKSKGCNKLNLIFTSFSLLEDDRFHSLVLPHKSLKGLVSVHIKGTTKDSCGTRAMRVWQLESMLHESPQYRISGVSPGSL